MVCLSCLSCAKGGVERRREQANAYLNQAREAYKAASLTMREAIELCASLKNNPDGSLALANANRDVALASAKYQDALKVFLDAIGARATFR